MLSDEEINKKMQELADKIEIICSTNTQFLEKNVILKIRDIDQETLINFVAFCSNLRNLYFKEKEKNKKIDEFCRAELAFERRLKREDREPDEFNQGRFYVSENIRKIIEEE